MFISFHPAYGPHYIGATIHTRQEIQFLRYAGFFLCHELMRGTYLRRVPQSIKKKFTVNYYHITYSQTEEEGSAVVVESPGSAYHHYSQAVTQAA